jgi:hypothetical protein
MTRISLEVMVGRGAAAFTASLFCCCVRGEPGVAPVFSRAYVGDTPVLGLAFYATDFFSGVKRDKLEYRVINWLLLNHGLYVGSLS